MIRPRLKNRFSSRLSLLFLLVLGASANAAEVPLRSFSASYDLYKGGMHVAVTELKLERAGELWRWSSLTRPRGVYAWFVKKQPLVQTSFSRHADSFRLQEILIGDARRKQQLESARFDWDKGEMAVMRKGKHQQVRLDGDVFDYQSIHLLAASMGQQGKEKITVDFYRKGKLVKSHIVYGGRERVDVNGESAQARVFGQIVSKSKSKVKYYYDDKNPLLPLRIETLESGKSLAVMTLRQIDWDL